MASFGLGGSFTSCLREFGVEDVVRVVLRGLSRSAAGSLYEFGGRLGLLDW